tara:strand:+ start:48 stop:461 length:414 start_codon:yes stop_codon:yes gene_type:complete
MENILTTLLNGHSELSKKILDYKKELELDDARSYHINNYNIIDNSVNVIKNKINSIITYPHKLRIFNVDDLYHDDIFTNRFGIILNDIEQLHYLDLIHNNKLEPVIMTNSYIYYECDGFLIRYIQHVYSCDVNSIEI